MGIKKQLAFTLSEVLITIGIIGVVAAITLSSVISNIQGMQYRAKVKKVYSSLSQAVSLAKANYDVDIQYLTTDCVDGENDRLPSTYSLCGLFNSTLSGVKFLSSTDIKGLKLYSAISVYPFGYQFADGSVVVFDMPSDFTDNPVEIYGYIDVNGKAAPNKLTLGTERQMIHASESYTNGAFSAIVYNGKPEKFNDTYFFRLPLRQYDPRDSEDHGPLRYILTH